MANVIIRISDGQRQIYDYRQELWQSGFVFNKRSNGNSFYEMKADEETGKQWELYAKKNKLSCILIPEQYTRSDDYRKEFFKEAQPATPAKYRCAYCGKKLLYKDTTVDHIIPVNKMSYNKSVQKMAKRMGIENVNDPKNLVAACRSCNSRKSTKMGMWVYRGFLGKSEKLWKLRIALRWTVAIVFILCVVCVLSEFVTFPHIKIIL